MPAHLEDRNIISEVEGLNSALIVACNMCAGASFAMKENKPFIQFFSNFLTSPPLKRYIAKLQFQLKEKGVKTKWFKRGIIQKFFLCLWTSRQRIKFKKCADKYDSVIVLGCDSAFKTIRDSLQGTACKVIEGTKFCGSERLTGAMLDRLTHRVHIIEANGASYRLEQSRKRLARQKKIADRN